MKTSIDTFHLFIYSFIRSFIYSFNVIRKVMSRKLQLYFLINSDLK